MALGILEVRGITASVESADAMVKAAAVEVIGTQKIGNALIFIAIRGSVDAVYAAIESGKATAKELGEVYAYTVLANPCEETIAIIDKIS